MDSLFPRGAKRPAETIKRKGYMDLTIPRGPTLQKKQHPQSNMGGNPCGSWEAVEVWSSLDSSSKDTK